MNALWQELSYGLRMFARNPGFTVVAVLNTRSRSRKQTRRYLVLSMRCCYPKKNFPVTEARSARCCLGHLIEKVQSRRFKRKQSARPATGLTNGNHFISDFLETTARKGALSDVFAFGSVDLESKCERPGRGC